MRLFGLIGFPLAQSFSKKYFTEKFLKENIKDAAYELFQIETINTLAEVLRSNPLLAGLNVTIPYKQQVIPFLNEVDTDAQAMGAVNCITVRNGYLKGYNTDAPAFERTLRPLLQPHHQKALILGTGGASKAVEFVLQQMGIEYRFVSRTPKAGQFSYADLTPEIMDQYCLVINTTPLGSFPKVDTAPEIPYQYLSGRHCLYDLVYNPAKTLFLQKGAERGAIIQNGYDMLVQQAELGWEIWNRP